MKSQSNPNMKAQVNPKTGEYDKLFDIEDVLIVLNLDFNFVVAKAKELGIEFVHNQTTHQLFHKDATYLIETIRLQQESDNVPKLIEREKVSYWDMEKSVKDTKLYKIPPHITRRGFYNCFNAYPHDGEHCDNKLWLIPTKEEIETVLKWINKKYPTLLA